MISQVGKLAPLLTSRRPDWNTPENLLRVVRQLGPIGLDPCSNANSIVGAAVEWSEADDGLSRPWECDVLVYVNPPYGREIGKWMDKCACEASLGSQIVALVPARTDARWWQEHATRAAAICFWRGRLRFLGASASAPFPSAVLYWGPDPERFITTFQPYGWSVRI